MILFKPYTMSLKKFSFSNYKIQYHKHCRDKKVIQKQAFKILWLIFTLLFTVFEFIFHLNLLIKYYSGFI